MRFSSGRASFGSARQLGDPRAGTLQSAARLLILGLCTACLSGHDVTAPDDPDLSVIGGDQQIGYVHASLDAPLSIRVLSHRGRPRVGIVIRWSAEGGGRVTPNTSITNDSGVARATWTLGPSDGPQSAHAASDRYHKRVTFHAVAQLSGGDAPLVVMDLDTPDHSGQTVHPDYVGMPTSWAAAAAYLVLTPYRYGDGNLEDPSLFAGDGSFAWHRPPGVKNPLVMPDTGYLSDPDALYVPESKELWIYFRAVDELNEIQLIKSRDGVHFSEPEKILTRANHTLVSPSIVRRGPMDWEMWVVNANVGCGAASTSVDRRTSSDGVHWSLPAPVHLAQPGYTPWHIDVQWIPSLDQYWALYNVKTPGNCNTPAVYLATSADGVHWTTYPSPVLAHGVIPEFQDIVYRSTFAYDSASDGVSLWFSGAQYQDPHFVWRSAYQHRTRAKLFAMIAQQPASGAVADKYPRRRVPPLMDAP
jgi:hypothetical protein